MWDEFPALYRKLLPTWFGQSYEPEALATCRDCAMCRPNPGRHKIATYQPHLKCCTFYPDLPNYLVGALLSDTDPATAEGQKRVRNLIQQRSGVSPYGVNAPLLRELLYAHAGGDAFGNSETLLCPYFHRENHNCSIWRYRNAVCSTFFCKYNDGRAGEAFWQSVKEYLGFVQGLLSEVALERLNFPSNALPANPMKRLVGRNTRLSAADLDGRVDDATWYKLWGDYAGREDAFFIACYREISQLTPDDLATLGGFEERRHAAKVQAAKRAVDYPQLPPVLHRNPSVRIHEEREQHIVVEGFNGLTEMPILLWRFIQTCSGEETEQTIAAFETKHGLEIEEDLIINMVQNRFLLAEEELAG
ncbi:hypothetical protein APED_18905 [Acanthopleuribacter pedis]